MAPPPILRGGPSTSGDATISSALGVVEHLSIRIDTMREREEAAPGVAVSRGAAAARDVPAIHITIRHVDAAVDVGPSSLAPSGNRSRPSGPRSGRGSASIARSGSNSDSDSSSGGAWPDDTRQMRRLRAEMKGVFDILSLVMALVVPVVVLAYTQLPDDSSSAHRNVWISLGTIVSLAIIGAVIARFGATETATEISSCIGLLASIVLILISGIVLVELLQHEAWSMFWGTVICICLMIADVYAWTKCAKRPKCLISCIRGCPGCFHNSFMAMMGFFDWLLSCGDPGHQKEGLIRR